MVDIIRLFNLVITFNDYGLEIEEIIINNKLTAIVVYADEIKLEAKDLNNGLFVNL